jgi:hypothetical protein
MELLKEAPNILVSWLVESQQIAVGPAGRTVLQLRGRREAEINSVKVEFPSHPEGLHAEMAILPVLPDFGKRFLPVQSLHGPQRITARGDLPAPALLNVIVFETIDPPSCWWHWAGRLNDLLLWPGKCLGIVVTTREPALCKVTVGGN